MQFIHLHLHNSLSQVLHALCSLRWEIFKGEPTWSAKTTSYHPKPQTNLKLPTQEIDIVYDVYHLFWIVPVYIYPLNIHQFPTFSSLVLPWPPAHQFCDHLGSFAPWHPRPKERVYESTRLQSLQGGCDFFFRHLFIQKMSFRGKNGKRIKRAKWHKVSVKTPSVKNPQERHTFCWRFFHNSLVAKGINWKSLLETSLQLQESHNFLLGLCQHCSSACSCSVHLRKQHEAANPCPTIGNSKHLVLYCNWVTS